MRIVKFFALFFSLLLFAGFYPPQKKVSLIIAAYDDNAAVNHLQHLVNYVFVDGAMVSQETLLSVPTVKTGVKGNYVRFDIGKNTIYRNRYIITGIGNVIDIQAKKILVEERGDLVKCSGDSIIFHTNDIFKGKYYSVLDLRTGKFAKVENPNYNPLPRPDVEVDETKQPFSISAFDVAGKETKLVADAGYGEAQPLLGDDVKRKFAIFWLDNSNFLYANFTKNQQSAAIWKVNTNKSAEKVGDITEIPATAANAFFEMGNDGNVIYSCGKGRFVIDLKKKTVTKAQFEPLGNNFYVESDENPKYGRTIRYESAEAGKKWCRLDNAKTTDGYAAFQSDMVIGTERYPQGVAVWNATTKKWTTLDVSSLGDIVGWVDNQ
jgi:hypothetical protein